MPNPWPSPYLSTAVVASPALAAETIIAQLKIGTTADVGSTIDLTGWAAYTIGTSGSASRLRIRRDSLTGTVVGDSGALTQGRAAGTLQADDVEGIDTPGEVSNVLYVLTLQVTAGAAVSTVSAVKLRAVIIG